MYPLVPELSPQILLRDVAQQLPEQPPKLLPGELAGRIVGAIETMITERLNDTNASGTSEFAIKVMTTGNQGEVVLQTTATVLETELSKPLDFARNLLRGRVSKDELIDRIRSGRKQFSVLFSPNWQEMALVEKMAELLRDSDEQMLLVSLDSVTSEGKTQLTRIVLGW